MSIDPHFKRLADAPSESVSFVFEEETLTALRGDSVAAAILAAGHLATRTTPVSGSPRGPYCLMGMCFECLLEIDGQPNRQSCLVEVQDGMRVRRMQGARKP